MRWLAGVYALGLVIWCSSGAPAQVDARLLRNPDVSATQVVFVYAGDLWLAPKQGGEARRLSSPVGEESTPRFSPDGTQVAFTGNYDGNRDVYVIPTKGGLPRRITHHPDDDLILDWTPDGRALLYKSAMESGRSRFRQVYRTSPRGGFPEKLPVPYAETAALSSDGNLLAFTRMPDTFNRAWKRYRGGTAPDIWLMNLRSLDAQNVSPHDAVDSWPMWHGDRLYFVSERGPNRRTNLWRYDHRTGASRQVTFFDAYDVLDPAVGPREIVFENGGRLHLLDIATETHHPIEIRVITDGATLKPRVENVSHRTVDGRVSPTGKRAVFEARGEIFTVPAEHGFIRNLTRSPGVAERYPTWSPDGTWIAYQSDRSGEYELTLRRADGSGEERTLTSEGPGFRYRAQWSPDSAKLLFVDSTRRIRLVTIDSGEVESVGRLGRELHGGLQNFQVSWSKDSRWIAWPKRVENGNSAVFLHDTASGETHQATSGYYDDGSPVFDPRGEYLYILTSRSLSPIYSDLQGTWVYTNTTQVAAIPLRNDVPSPLTARNDEERSGDADSEDAKEPDTPKNADEDESPEGDPEEVEKAPETWEIDFDGFERRVILLPPEAGNYASLHAVDGKVVYRRFPKSGSGGGPAQLLFFDLKERKESTVVEGAGRVRFSANGKKVLIQKGRDWFIIDLAPGQKPKQSLRVSELEMRIDPVAEWRQLFADAWRFERDFFYDPDLHGLDWDEMRLRYHALLDHAVTRWDVNFVLRQLVGELGAGHIFASGGPTPEETRRGSGLLGVDFAVDRERYRIRRILDAGPRTAEVRSPLAEPGVNVREGDYLLAVNGVPLDVTHDPWAAFDGLAGKTVLLTVNDEPTLEGAREVLVESLASDRRLRELDWVESNRQRVETGSEGRVGYIYVPDTGVTGQTEFVRQLLAQWTKDGLIIDERFNSGGQLPDRFIEMLRRPLYNFIHVRGGTPWQVPEAAPTGPKVMLINGWSGSGGDAFPFFFQQAKIGPVIGRRTWGGLVGPSHAMPLIDGGVVSAPPARFLGLAGEWVVEGRGVEPDIELLNDPGLMAQGRDPQLERAIEEVLRMLKEDPPPKEPDLPPFPNVSRQRTRF